jgi:hypothetical protein
MGLSLILAAEGCQLARDNLAQVRVHAA